MKHLERFFWTSQAGCVCASLADAPLWAAGYWLAGLLTLLAWTRADERRRKGAL